ncbi:uncharacterized protein BYT42DRAFT_574245 [Radiomyces spectabilis]|uniref:uncharacterized protein n=1 Tax=Radiomyces spectabilis TaxID=64574 RepID=UPI0022202D94|nr:uncharacterized protein BYT42DRAFT_574245 [Radiomyces spectabilis]KAI8376333.1 hypothetical protein BYT42DRAFT_574245 [Radiomyces spectabilis]
MTERFEFQLPDNMPAIRTSIIRRIQKRKAGLNKTGSKRHSSVDGHLDNGLPSPPIETCTFEEGHAYPPLLESRSMSKQPQPKEPSPPAQTSDVHSSCASPNSSTISPPCSTSSELDQETVRQKIKQLQEEKHKLFQIMKDLLSRPPVASNPAPASPASTTTATATHSPTMDTTAMTLQSPPSPSLPSKDTAVATTVTTPTAATALAASTLPPSSPSLSSASPLPSPAQSEPSPFKRERTVSEKMEDYRRSVSRDRRHSRSHSMSQYEYRFSPSSSSMEGSFHPLPSSPSQRYHYNDRSRAPLASSASRYYPDYDNRVPGASRYSPLHSPNTSTSHAWSNPAYMSRRPPSGFPRSGSGPIRNNFRPSRPLADRHIPRY